MSTEPTRRPPFYCPACGKKHRADLSAIQGTSGAIARVDCARCEAVMSLRIGDDGLPKCEILEHPPQEADAAPAAAASPGGTMAKSGMSLSLIAAAVVAAIVSFGVGQLTAGGGGDAAAPAGDERVKKLEQMVALLEKDLREARSKADDAHALATTAHTGVRSLTGSIDGGMKANTAKVTAIETAQAALTESFAGAKARYENLDGRIEGNYTELFRLKKRVKKLEGN